MITGLATAYNYLHLDWIGNARLASSRTRTVTADQAYTPYGEIDFSNGSTSAQYDVFAGTSALFDTGVMYDTPNRELSIVGRWLSADPAGRGWNQDAYPTNPNSLSDPSGLNSEDRGCGRWCESRPDANSGVGSDNPEWGLFSAEIANFGYGQWVDVNIGTVGTGGTSGMLDWRIGGNGQGAWYNSLNGEEVSSDAAAELGYSSPGGSACSGGGIPCSLKQSPLERTVGRLKDGRYGIQQSYVYTVVDINGRPTAVDSVSEILTPILLVNAALPENATWSTFNELLHDGLYFTDVISLASFDPNYIGSGIITQNWKATVGGTEYLLRSVNSVFLVTGPTGSAGSAVP